MKIIQNPKFDIWDSFIEKTSQYSIYSSSIYFSLFKNEVDWYLVEEKGDIIAGVILKKKEESIAPIYYNGIFIKKKYQESFKIIEICNFIIEELINKKNFFYVRTHYNFKDIRSFQWFNYGKAKSKLFTIKPFFTGCIDIEEKSINKIYSEFNSLRKRKIKKSSEQLITKTSDDFKILDKLSCNSNPTRDLSEKYLTTILAKHSLKKGFGTLLVTENKDKIPLSASLFFHDKYAAYYCVGGYDPNYKNSGASSVNIYNQIKIAKGKKLKKVDFVGVNSPNRGFFKYTFGSKLKNYFEIKLSL